jgi:uncharacterized Zn finger protein (UPF0148 family)
MPDSNDDKLVVELVACSRCGNPYMVKKGEKKAGELICDNCIKLEQRKKLLELGVIDNVIESQKEIGNSFIEMRDQLSEAHFSKKLYLEKIKKKSELLTKSIELLEKIHETKDEKYVEEYKKLFEKLKEDYS